jgi:hypothetical protein
MMIERSQNAQFSSNNHPQSVSKFHFTPIGAGALAESGQPTASQMYDTDSNAFTFFIIRQYGDRYPSIGT